MCTVSYRCYFFEGDYNSGSGTCSITSNGIEQELVENFFVYGDVPKNFLYEELGGLYFSPSDREKYLHTMTSGMGNEQLLKLFDYLLANGRYRGANYLPENQSIHYDYVSISKRKPVDFGFSHEGEEFSRDVLQEEDYLLALQPGSWPLSTDFKDQLDIHISAVSNITRNKSEADGLTFLRYYIKNLMEKSKVDSNVKHYVAKNIGRAS